MQGKNNNQKLRTKSAGIHNIIITNKAIKPNKNNKSNKFAQLKGKRAIPDLKNEKVISNINIEKAFSLNSNYRTNNNKKPTKGNNNKSNKRSKSFNLIQRVKKDNQGSNKKKQIINNINVNINHINNIHISKKEIDLSIRNKSFGKIMNTNKAKKPSTNYNAFKIKPKNNNKISKTEEKNGLKQSPAINQIQKSNLFSNFQKKEKKSVNSTIFSKLNNKNNNHPVSAKSTLNKNTKKYSIGKIINQRPKNILKKNLSIENNNKKPKQSINKIPPKDKIMQILNQKINSTQKKGNEKNKNDSKKNNNKIVNKKSANIIKTSNDPKPKNPNNKNIIQKKSNEIQSKITQVKSFSKPTLIGLNNIGATCFINSTLQCLSQTEDLTNYFLNEKNKDNIIKNNIALNNQNENQLSPYYLELINKLWDKKTTESKSFSPDNFVKIINEMNPLFKLGEAGDSKDFIIYILDQLHQELKKPIKLQAKTPVLNQYDKENAFQYFQNTYQKEKSIISELFYGVHESTNICLNCKENYKNKKLNNPICYSYGIFNCLIFPLEEVKNFKIKNISKKENEQIEINSNNSVNIYDCFNFYQKSDLFTGDNKNYCNICNQLYDSIYNTRIYSSPNYLILILNRGKGNIYNIKLEFPESINITKFVIKKEKPNIIYNLYGVLTHIGESGPDAHFVASCKSPVDNKWYRYNDAFVEPINDVQKDVIDFGTPYILFYKKMK